MNVITVFRDPGWSLDVVTNMPKMQWIALYTDMIEEADVFINGKRVLWSKADGANVSDALKQLTHTQCVLSLVLRVLLLLCFRGAGSLGNRKCSRSRTP